MIGQPQRRGVSKRRTIPSEVRCQRPGYADQAEGLGGVGLDQERSGGAAQPQRLGAGVKERPGASSLHHIHQFAVEAIRQTRRQAPREHP